MEVKSLGEYTREEFLAMDYMMPEGTFTDLIIVPTDELHDSGYRCMRFVLVNRGNIVGVVGGGSDVVHIDGIGGYGINGNAWSILEKDPKLGIVDWSIDCLPVSGCLRLFSSKECVIRDGYICSDFVFFVKIQFNICNDFYKFYIFKCKVIS